MNQSLAPLKYVFGISFILIIVLTLLGLNSGFLKVSHDEPACLYGKSWRGEPRFIFYSFPLPFGKSTLQIRPHEYGCDKRLQYDPHTTTNNGEIPPGVIPPN